MFSQQNHSYWHVHLIRWRKYGSGWIVRRIFFKILRLSIGFFLQPLALIAHCCGIRKINVAEGNIGHLASDPDCLIKLVKLNLLPKRYYCIAAPAKNICNNCLLEYWRQYFIIIKNPILSYLFKAASSYGLIKFDVRDFITTETNAARYYEVCSLWGNRKPLLTLSDSHRRKGYDALRRLGMPGDAWFVCLHVREGGYASEWENLHSYRNADVNNCRMAIQTIASHGGWVIRMGDPTMKKLDPLLNCIDYIHTPEKSDWMDVFLCAECKFFVGNTSGLFLVSTIFGVPSALVNMTPFAAKAYLPTDIYIPKLLRDKKTGKYLKISDIFQSPLANIRDAQHYQNLGLFVEENTPEDINDLIREALNKFMGTWNVPQEDEMRQQKFSALFRKEDYGSQSQSRIGSAFISKYEHLM